MAKVHDVKLVIITGLSGAGKTAVSDILKTPVTA